jgi:hypothetical protein
MDNTIKKGTHLRKKQRFGQMKKKQSYLYLDNSDLSCLDLAEKVKVFHNRTENAITAMIYNLKQASEPRS